MDLGTLRAQFSNDAEAFANDVKLVFTNALAYCDRAPNSDKIRETAALARKMQSRFDRKTPPSCRAAYPTASKPPWRASRPGRGSRLSTSAWGPAAARSSTGSAARACPWQSRSGVLTLSGRAATIRRRRTRRTRSACAAALRGDAPRRLPSTSCWAPRRRASTSRPPRARPHSTSPRCPRRRRHA